MFQYRYLSVLELKLEGDEYYISEVIDSEYNYDLKQKIKRAMMTIIKRIMDSEGFDDAQETDEETRRKRAAHRRHKKQKKLKEQAIGI